MKTNWKDSEQRIWNQVRGQIKIQIGDQIWVNFRDQVRSQIEDQIVDQIWNCISNHRLNVSS